MSLATQKLVVEKYGLRLTMAQLAEMFNVTKGGLSNMVSAGTCPVKTYRSGGKRWADFRDVAEHLDLMREMAK